ncbi:MAG: flagellar biosynthetic protein FliO [Bdellovibrionales bacterium]|nr:flagellar biosynthetic protein FliO [Bdellovibrionales bacterium]
MMRLFIGIVLSLSVQQLSAKETSVNLLKTETFKKGSAFVTELEFSHPIEENKTSVEFINETIQVNIRDASVESKKGYKAVGDEKVKNLYIYQPKKDLLRARIIYKKPSKAKDFEGYVHISSNQNKLIITVEDPQAVVSAPMQKELPIVPPIDLNAELEPKVGKNKDTQTVEESAAALLEKEFLIKSKTSFQNLAPKDKSETLLAATSQVTSQAKTALPKTAIKSESQNESEIPLNIAQSKKQAGTESPWMRMILSLAIISIVGIAMIFVAKKYSKSNAKVGGNIKIKVISQQSLGPKKNLTVVRVAGEDILIGVTDYNISLIKSLSFIDDEIEENVPRHFVEELNKVTDKYVESRKPSLTARNANAPEFNEDEFNMGNIKDMISKKLKEMRPL